MNILFVGEIFPKITHGVSISNFINCEVLKGVATVDEIHEYTSLEQIGIFSAVKIRRILKYCLEIRSKSKTKDYDFFYFSLSLSVLGLVKNIFYLKALKKDRCKVITHLHRGDLEFFYSLFWRRILFNLLLKKVDKIICLSPQQSRDVSNLLGNIRITVDFLRNTIVEEEKFIKIYNQKKLNLDKLQVDNVVFLSNFLLEKGVFDIIKVAKSAPHLVFNLYGEFNANETLLKLEAPKNVNILGPTSGKEKLDLFKGNSVLVFPSWNEGQPLVLLEAMAAGLPIVATSVGLITDLLGKDYPYLVPPKNPEAILKKLVSIINAHDVSETSSKLHNKYLTEHSAKVHSEKLLSIFNNNESSFGSRRSTDCIDYNCML